MRRVLASVGVLGVLVLAGCFPQEEPGIPVVLVQDDGVNNTLDSPQVVEPALTFEQQIRITGTISSGPGISDVYLIDFPANADYRIAFDCTAGANVIVDFYDNQGDFIPPGQACTAGHLTGVISGSGVRLLFTNATPASVEAPYDITLELVAP